MRVVLAMLLIGSVAVGAASATANAAVAAPVAMPVCGPVPAGYARCLSYVTATPSAAGTTPTGTSPAQVKAAYFFPTSPAVGVGQTLAIVTAFDSPSIEADLAIFDQQYGLPSCTAANGCLTKLNEAGAPSPLPAASDAGWDYETHIDVEWAHAIAPSAKILLFEPTTNAILDQIHTEDVASRRARYVSNSWGTREGAPEAILDHHFTDFPGVSYFFGSGDDGVPLWPSASPSVVSVGGTRLGFTAGVPTTETAWSGSGGGCSQFESASAAQAAFAQYPHATCAGRRAVPDLSSVADTSSGGVSVFDSRPTNGTVGWSGAAGTSVATPIVAARAASSGAVINQSRVYGPLGLLGTGVGILYRDILTGSNGFFSALNGYDLVTGRGSWTL